MLLSRQSKLVLTIKQFHTVITNCTVNLDIHHVSSDNMNLTGRTLTWCVFLLSFFFHFRDHLAGCPKYFDIVLKKQKEKDEEEKQIVASIVCIQIWSNIRQINTRKTTDMVTKPLTTNS